MRIGFIGAGKVGFTLGKYILAKKEENSTLVSLKNVEVSGYYSRNKNSAVDAAEFTNTHCYNSLEQLIDASDVLMLTVPDSIIEQVWNELLTFDLKGKLICHCSGAMTSKIFSGVTEAGAFGYSIHPMYAISSKSESYKTLGEALFSVEGDEHYLIQIRDFIVSLGNECVIISGSDKVKYHSAAVMASNLVTGLYTMAGKLLMECGFDSEQSDKALMPLFSGNAKNLSEKGAVESLTGPIERNDTATVRKHIEVLTGNYRQAYIALSKGALDVAVKKHPDRDYEELRLLLNGK
ncbi:MAG: Rossmann-like and DUF2520 domain-containing protein [Coprococcus sp.]